MYSIGDDLSWTHGKHAFKGGFEFRHTLSSGFGDPGFTPYVTFGAGNQTIAGLDTAGIPTLTANNAATARNLLTDLTASIGVINQSFGIKNATDTTLKGSPEIPAKYFRQVQREMSAYFKDEWKFRPDLTLNLGVHWEYYGQPFEKTGLDARVIGDDESAFTKITCPASPGTAGFDTTCTNLTQVQFVGKNSTHPDILPNLKGNDLNSWAPAVGLSWNLPWFGKNKTVLRSGYGINYIGALRNFITVDSTLGTVPGINIVGSGGTGLTVNPSTYTNISTVTLPVSFPPGTPTSSPFTVPTTDRSQTISTYNRVSAYTQNWNLEIQRQLAENTTIEIRYIGTKGTKLWGTINLNQIDALHHNKELFDAFNAVRRGEDSPLLTTMLMGINLVGTGAQAVNGSTWTGAMAVRTNTTTRAQLATGNVGGFLDFLNTNNTGGSRGNLLRKNGFPENYIVANPQYGTVSMLDNLGNSTYHSLQMQFTRRLTRGFTNTTSWTWSRSLGDSDSDTGSNYRDPTRRSIEKSLLGFDRQHQITSNGTYELPFGTGHFLLGNAPGWVQQIVNKWQLGGIMNFNTGAALNLTAGAGTLASPNIYTISAGGQAAPGTPNIVGALPKDMGKVTKVSNGGVYLNGFQQVTDPGFASVSPNCVAPATACNGLVGGNTNKAIQGPDGQIVLVNPQPGELGTLGYATVRGPRSLNFDMNLIKRFQIHEAKNFEFRLDVINILNHPNFGTPTTNINATGNSFGRISSATGSRSFIVNTRINF